MSTQEDVSYWITPPTAATGVGGDANHQVLSTTTSSGAANYDWATALGSNRPQGAVFILLEASTKDVYVRFKSGPPNTASASVPAAATTVTNGLIIKADQPGRRFYVNPETHGVIDHIATGTGTLQVQVSSPIGARNKQ